MFQKIVLSSILLLTVAMVPFVTLAYSSPGSPLGYVNDFAHVLSDSQIKSLNDKLANLDKTTGDQVAVVTVTSLGGDTIENYANKLFQDWGIGGSNLDSGLLILVSTGDHQARIEVGYGLEGIVTDLQSGNIIRQVMTPAFKGGDYDTGISGAVDAVTSIITDSPDSAQYSVASTDNQNSSSSQGSDSNWPAIIFFVIIIINTFYRIFSRTKSWWLGGVIGAGLGVGVGFIWGFFYVGVTWIIILTVLGLVFDYIASKKGPPKNGSGGRGGGIGSLWPLLFLGGRGGGGLGGSGGGGFGGFGGGSSGGGGASGRW